MRRPGMPANSDSARLAAPGCASNFSVLAVSKGLSTHIPVEIWMAIFEMHASICWKDRAPDLDANKTDIKRLMAAHHPLMLVCRVWRDIAVATPSLWTVVAFHLGPQPESLAVKHAYPVIARQLERSKGFGLEGGLSATFNGTDLLDLKSYTPALELLFSASARFVSLFLTDVYALRSRGPGPGAALQRLHLPTNFPRLQRLSFIQEGGAFAKPSGDAPFWNAVQRAPTLRYFRMSRVEDISVPLGVLDDLDASTARCLLWNLSRAECRVQNAELLPGPPSIQTYEPQSNATLKRLTVDGRNDDAVMLLTQFNPSALVQLRIHNFDGDVWTEAHNGRLVLPVILATNYASIQHLALHAIDYSKDAYEAGLKAVLQGLPLIRILDVSDCFRDGLGDYGEGVVLNQFPLHVLSTLRPPDDADAKDHDPTTLQPPAPSQLPLPLLERLTYRVEPRIFEHRGMQFPGWMKDAFVRDSYTMTLRAVLEVVSARMRMRNEAGGGGDRGREGHWKAVDVYGLDAELRAGTAKWFAGEVEKTEKEFGVRLRRM
ncbi:F-box domain-containing protein [Mycena kentingensis (nom. inval.)]|nr:F-box domain-containing protein [Mycena kentingensis (nom. inval.)]